MQPRLDWRLTLVALLVGAVLSTWAPVAKAAAAPKRKPPANPAPRIEEMLEWLEREQQPRNGGYTWRNHVGFSAGKVQYRDPKVGPPDVVDTAMVALALLRMEGAARHTRRNDVFARALAFVENAAHASDPKTLRLAQQCTPLTLRIGPHVDTFFALWLLAEVRDPGTPSQPDPLVTKLIAKVEANIRPDGSWAEPNVPALNSPLLGHAVGVRALETASRRGFKVNQGLVSRAAAYALGDHAAKHERAQFGKWKKDFSLRPKWQADHFLDDLEPINEALYVSAARLSVLDQADRSNATQEKAIRARLTTPLPTAELERIAGSLRGIVATRKTLAATRGQMFDAYRETKSFAPVIYCADDFLAALLTVDAMGLAAVEQWFPPTVRALLTYQDVDGGLKYREHVSCLVMDDLEPCECERLANFEMGMPRELCPKQLSFCARDRVFCTAAGLAILLADTPYRPAFLGIKQ